MEWQPIETFDLAPYERAIIFDLDWGVCTGYRDDEGDLWANDGVSESDAAATHWMPLPPPPAA